MTESRKTSDFSMTSDAKSVAQHTPTPWDYVPSTKDHGPYVTTQYGSTVCDCYHMSNPSALSVRNGGDSRPIHHMADQADANAARIVLAVNLHDELVEALRISMRTFRKYEAIHRAKPDHDKANANAALADHIETLLSKCEPEKNQDQSV